MPGGAFRLEDIDGVRLARCVALEEIPGVVHAFSTRVAHGRPDFDLGPARGASPEVLARREAFLSATGLSGRFPPVLQQVHGAHLVEDGGDGDGDGGLAVFETGTPSAPAVRSADCVLILLADRDGRAAASAHAGWRGTVASIAAHAVSRLGQRGIPPGRLVAALGPSAGPCCYEVGPEVARHFGGFTRAAGAGRVTIDLHAANASQLASAGVPPRSIHRAPWCTRCRNDLFFSARAEGAAAGRLMALVGKRRPP